MSFEELLSLRLSDHFALVVGCINNNWLMGAIHKMAATLGDSPAARALRGNFYGQPGLPHLAKHFFPGFLVLLPGKKASY